MYAVNLGTRGPEEARDIVEYANHPSGSKFSDMRIANGRKEPFGIKLWCLGNEMDGSWQMGQKTAKEYGRIANEAAKMMKWVDPTIETVACGSSASDMPTFGSWEYEMLEECYENVDYVSLHRYYANPTGDTPGFLARTLDMDDFIKSFVAVCDAVKGKKHSKHTVNLSFDEWNVWFHSNEQDKLMEPWQIAPPKLEDIYNLEDALVVGSLMITLLKNCDRVRMGCLAQLVNVIAPIMTKTGGGIWAQTIYYPFLYTSKNARGTVLTTDVACDTYDAGELQNIPYVDSVAVLSEDQKTLSIFAINRSLDEEVVLDLDMQGFEGATCTSHICLTGDDLKAVNTIENPDAVKPIEKEIKDTITLDKQSWNFMTFTVR